MHLLFSTFRPPTSVLCRLSSVFRSPLVWVFLLVLLVRVLYVVTYPPNIGGDCVGYYKMLTLGKSNLVHPPGYPFLVGLPVRTFLGLTHTAWWIDLHPVRVQYMVVAWQHIISFAVLITGALTVRRVFGSGSAVLVALCYGLWPRVFGQVSWFFPEWFQADLLILTLCALWVAYGSPSTRKKLVFYGLAAACFTWCFLTKYNALLFLPALVLVVLFDKARWGVKVAAMGLAVLVAAATVVPFILVWHKPSTGTAALSKDHAWVLLTALGQWSPGGTLNPEAGPQTKRLIYLNSVLPWNPSGVGPFWRIEESPDGPAFRAPWRATYLGVLKAGPSELDALLATVPSPASPYNFFTAFYPTYLHLGPDESEQLGIGVFLENLRAFPAAFARYYSRQTICTIWRWPSRRQYDGLPVEPLYAPVGRFWLWRREQGGPGQSSAFRYERPLVWRPGAVFLDILDRGCGWPTWPVAFAVVAYLVARMRQVWRGVEPIDGPAGAALLLGFLLVSYVAVMQGVFFRSKEAVVVTPVAMALFAAALVWCANLVFGAKSEVLGAKRR